MKMDYATFRKLVLLAKNNPGGHPFMVRSLLHGFMQPAKEAKWSVPDDVVNSVAEQNALPDTVAHIYHSAALSEEGKVRQALDKIYAAFAE
ncbi:hypothetical protein AAC03nite_35070 [Alicyclobacillus acidoterrestris]|uniref:hypothetical protein n=1 Tax=Alicyclobacillus suci TaxID=2816080 RepID=UPI0011978888|nr:hypothetical protein [Alicyclobacillus suci]GEO27722.1 hypothetical protein AAC03nite_35070 [Alicyclobacillus acidoterrestris]